MAKLPHFLFYFIIFGEKFLFNNHYLLKKINLDLMIHLITIALIKKTSEYQFSN